MKRVLFLFLILLLVGRFSARGEFPQRIISLAPSLTKNLVLLHAQNLVVGCTGYCPAAVRDSSAAEVVASAMQVNFEKALLLHPDLVITTGMTNPKIINTFRKLSIPVKVFPTPHSFQEICSQFVELGTMLGKQKFAQQLILRQQAKLKKIRTGGFDRKSFSVFMQIGANPLYGVVPGTFMNDFIRFSGGKNILANLKQGNVNRETVLLRNPDVIIVVLMGSLGKNEMENWEKFTALNAVKRQKVFTVNADNTCSPTPVSFVNALGEIIRLVDRPTAGKVLTVTEQKIN